MNRFVAPSVAVALAASLFVVARTGVAEEHQFRVEVDAGQPGARFSDTMHGVFFEDINYAADGGLYAEMVQNRSFEHPGPLFGWAATGDAKAEVVDSDGVHANNPKFCRLTVATSGDGIANGGFDGVDVVGGAKYRVSLHLRGAAAGEATAKLVGEGGEVLAEAPLGQVGAEWSRVETVLSSGAEAADAKLVIAFKQPGTYDLDVVSLFPVDTFRGRRNGLRKDLAELLENLKPAFVRFPGGCIVEGRTLDNAYRWKDTVGPIWERKQNYNLWAERGFPQYQQTYGLGFFEYFQFCEDVGAEPVPIVNCGMGCQFRGADLVEMDDLGEWVQDALDLVEFANGPITSRWGKLRADMGHPEPFNLKYLGVGNEQWMEDYFERYLVFHKAIQQEHPELQIISTSGPGAYDPSYHYAWRRFREGVPADLVDEHYYRPPEWFLTNSHRYDDYDRNGPKVFAGEFAAHEASRASTLRAAVCEAAFMTGLWRNADIVTMAAYAPLFAREGAIQWAPDLIWFNDSQSYGTPSYHVQAMYGRNVPDRVLPVKVDASHVPQPQLKGRVGIGTWLTKAEFKDLRVTRGDQTLYASDNTLDDFELFGGDWSAEDGVIRQSSEADNVRAFVGDPEWSDYTVHVTARKLSGREGFLVSFASTNPRDTSWWNLGGWGNSEHGVETPLIPQQRQPGRVEQGRWYDVRIEVKPDEVRCFLDGQLVQSAKLQPPPAVFAAAGLDEAAGECVIALANATDAPMTGRIDVAGATGAPAKAVCLTSDAATDVNSFADADQVEPSESAVEVADGGVNYETPAWSFTVLRVPVTK